MAPAGDYVAGAAATTAANAMTMTTPATASAAARIVRLAALLI